MLTNLFLILACMVCVLYGWTSLPISQRAKDVGIFIIVVVGYALALMTLFPISVRG